MLRMKTGFSMQLSRNFVILELKVGQSLIVFSAPISSTESRH